MCDAIDARAPSIKELTREIVRKSFLYKLKEKFHKKMLFSQQEKLFKTKKLDTQNDIDAPQKKR